MKRTPTSSRLQYKSFYRRNLPHIQPLNVAFFVTFRLAGSLPARIIAQMRTTREVLERTLGLNSENAHLRSRHFARRYFAMLEAALDKAKEGPTWLSERRIACIVAEALHYRDDKLYRLDAFSIMPNHVHTVFVPLTKDNIPVSLSSIMHSLKRNTSKQANRLLQRSGAFWEHETFDHYIRNRAEGLRIVEYVLNNPVKAGLVKQWQDWEWNYVRSDLAPNIFAK